MDYVKAAFLISGTGMVLAAAGILAHDLALEIRYRSALATSVGPIPAIPKPRCELRPLSPCWDGRR